MDGTEKDIEIASASSTQTTTSEEAPSIPESEVKSGNASYTLEQLAYTRSGDKADTSNIGRCS